MPDIYTQTYVKSDRHNVNEILLKVMLHHHNYDQACLSKLKEFET